MLFRTYFPVRQPTWKNKAYIYNLMGLFTQIMFGKHQLAFSDILSCTTSHMEKQGLHLQSYGPIYTNNVWHQLAFRIYFPVRQPTWKNKAYIYNLMGLLLHLYIACTMVTVVNSINNVPMHRLCMCNVHQTKVVRWPIVT